jgi:uncharacterized protein (PEP-CTERM system associated)
LALATAAAIGVAAPAGAQAPGMPDGSISTGGASLPGPAAYQVGPGLETTAPRRGGLGWWTETSITAQATATNNANYGQSTDREGDVILELIPAINFNREGARLRVNGFVSLDMLAYVQGTQADRILPQADVIANLEAVENLFFIDGAITANQAVENPFLPRSEASSTNNLYTYAQARLTPYLQGRFGQYGSWLIRSDNTYTWTSQSDNPLGNAYYGRQLAQVVRDPTPFGVTLRLSSDLTRIENQVQPDQTLNTALAIFDYAFSPQLTVGLRGGYEETTYTATEESGPIYGGNISWRPTPTSSVIGYYERRFYGPSYQVEASHRQRRLSTSVSAYRTITTYPQLLLQIPSTNNVSALLDAILIARFPDPTARQAAVNDLINRQALPQSLPAGAFIYNQSANILTGANASFGLLGVRNTLVLNVFYLKTQLLPDARVPTTFLAFNNNEQLGAGLTLSHQLSPIINLNGTVSGYQTEGFGPTEGLETRQGLASVQVNWQLSRQNTFFVGTRYQYQKNRSAATTFFDNTSEASIFAGLFHRL